MNDPTLGDACPVYQCIFIDLRSQGQHDAKVSHDGTELTLMIHASGERVWACTKQ